MGSRSPHTATTKGKRVIVQLRNGDVFVDKFKDKKSKFVFFEKRGKVPIETIKSFTIYKPNSKLQTLINRLDE